MNWEVEFEYLTTAGAEGNHISLYSCRKCGALIPRRSDSEMEHLRAHSEWHLDLSPIQYNIYEK